MLELSGVADIVRAINWLYLVVIAFFVGISLWFPPGWWRKAIGVAVTLIVFLGPLHLLRRERDLTIAEHKARVAAAEALFKERCKSAGEKIYKTVDNVEGVLLLKVRHYEADKSNPLMVGAAAAHEFIDDSYIRSFLLFEREVADKRFRALAEGGDATSLPGYRFVEVIDQTTQKRYRYTLNSDMRMEREEAFGKPPAYAVTFDDIVDREDRKHWVAGSTIKVLDWNSKAVLGESTRYVIEPGLGSRAGQRTPWLFARGCGMKTSYGQYSPRLFVDQVLKPSREPSR